MGFERAADDKSIGRDGKLITDDVGYEGSFNKGGRIGYRNGEFVEEDINIKGPGFDLNENID